MGSFPRSFGIVTKPYFINVLVKRSIMNKIGIISHYFIQKFSINSNIFQNLNIFIFSLSEGADDKPGKTKVLL